MNDTQLKQLLRQKRQEIAALRGVPVFMIFANKVIDSIVAQKPKTIEELLQIKGMGEMKVKQFGQIILSLVNEFPAEKEENSDRPEGVFSVSEFITALNIILIAQKATVQGEVIKYDDRGNYIYITLKDAQEDVVLNCFIWKNVLENSGVDVETGMEIRVFGHPEIYPRTNSFSFRIQNIELVGEGALQIAFERLKKKLASEGLFDQKSKKSIPDFVKNIGLITSQHAAARTDFLTHLTPSGFKIHFYDVRVEGIHAVDEITAAIRFFNESNLPLDVLVITRGGGSLESLQAFNTERIARAIHASRIPTLVAVGHERDVTIADLVADLRASTPTDAGKIISAPWTGVVNQIGQLRSSISREFALQLARHKETTQAIREDLIAYYFRELKRKKEVIGHASALLLTNMQQIFNSMKQFKINFIHNGQKIEQTIQEKRHAIELHREQLIGYDPLARLAQGYSIVERSGKIVKTVENVIPNDQLDIRLVDGRLRTSVLEKEKRDE